jgi:hypothetical protein
MIMMVFQENKKKKSKSYCCEKFYKKNKISRIAVNAWSRRKPHGEDRIDIYSIIG